MRPATTAVLGPRPVDRPMEPLETNVQSGFTVLLAQPPHRPARTAPRPPKRLRACALRALQAPPVELAFSWSATTSAIARTTRNIPTDSSAPQAPTCSSTTTTRRRCQKEDSLTETELKTSEEFQCTAAASVQPASSASAGALLATVLQVTSVSTGLPHRLQAASRGRPFL